VIHRNRTIVLASLFVLLALGTLYGVYNSNQKTHKKTLTIIPYHSPVNLADNNPTEIGMFVDFPGWSLKDWSGSIPEEITKRTGVKLNVTVATDDRELPRLIASDNLPELVFTDRELTRLSNNKMSYDWNSLIEEYAPDFKIDKIKIALNTQTNGKFYTILSDHSSQQELEGNKWVLPNGPGLAVRQDIMQQLGSPALDTLDDFEKILAMVKIRWPDMIPLVSDDVNSFAYINAQFGQVAKENEFYKNENGSLNYYIKQPGKLDFYQYVNKLYREGFISAVNFSYGDGSKDAQELVKDGKAFAIIGTAQIADKINDDLRKDAKKYQMMMIANPLSNKVKYYNYSAGTAGVFITQKNKHLSESIHFMKFMFSQEGQQLGVWGVEGKDWTMNSSGYPDFKYNTQEENYLENNGLFWWGKMSGDAVIQGLRNYVPALLATPVREQIKRHTVYDPVMGLLSPPAYSDEKTDHTKLKNMVTNEQLKIYLAKSAEEVVIAYNDMLKKANEIGVQKYEFSANKQYEQAASKIKQINLN
jgi:putative aldouronate transport system substrate-binding protein